MLRLQSFVELETFTNRLLAMNQGLVDPETAKKDLDTMADILDRKRYENLAGFNIEGQNKPLTEDSKERVDQVLDEAMDEGGFRVLFTYNDILINPESNRYVYDRLTARTRSRMTNPVKRDILAPLEPPHPFASKRPSLEQE